MHISRIELENIKSHASAAFDLARGTTAITGPNGAGKSTIVEAIAWVLFDLLEYKKEDFVRRGEKKGSVTITFESGLDEREYVVFRDTSTAYHITDPRLGMRIANKKEEVFRFLWQHLGLEPGTDLRSLFRQAIGVPQGTLTAIFLEGATERKVAFDRLLKVEEYRQAAEKLRETSRFLDQSVGRARETIARAEGELSRHDEVETERKNYSEQLRQLDAEIAANQTAQTAAKSRVAELENIERNVNALRTKLEQVRSQAGRSEIVLNQLRLDVAKAAEAHSQVEAAKPGAERHLKAQEKLKELERERSERDRLKAEIVKIDAAVVNIEAERKTLNADLTEVQAAHSEIESVRPYISQQKALESELNDLRNKAAVARSAAARLTAVDEKLSRLRESYRSNNERMKHAEDQIIIADSLAHLETRNSELMHHLAEMRAALSRDEKFQSEIKGGLCPVLSQKCLNLSEGQTLDGFLSSQFTEVRSHISELDTERSTVEVSLTAARKAAQQVSALEDYRHRAAELTREGQELRDEKSSVEHQAAELTGTEAAITTAEATLKTLDDPRARVRFLEKQDEREPLIRKGLSDTESNLEHLNSDRNQLIEQLEAYRAFDVNWAELSAEREATAEAFRTLLANEAEAGTLAKRRDTILAAESDASRLEADLATSEKETADAEAAYDRERHTAEREALRELENVFHSSAARLEAARQQEQKLGAELERFASLRKSLQGEFKEKERLETIAETTAFIRDTLKEAAPRVARNYVYHVSLEANQLFREITGNAERTLKWAEDYSVVLEEEGYERPFISLSGGEQMAAALAIRLGLLKQLTDIRIAFFDEPTANMDAERRDNLGQQISRITHFDQLIVISHDDTFDSYVDNVISLG
ncbi:SMC family ATPase [soil metagenome]